VSLSVVATADAKGNYGIAEILSSAPPQSMAMLAGRIDHATSHGYGNCMNPVTSSELSRSDAQKIVRHALAYTKFNRHLFCSFSVRK